MFIKSGIWILNALAIVSKMRNKGLVILDSVFRLALYFLFLG